MSPTIQIFNLFCIHNLCHRENHKDHRPMHENYKIWKHEINWWPTNLEYVLGVIPVIISWFKKKKKTYGIKSLVRNYTVSNLLKESSEGIPSGSPSGQIQCRNTLKYCKPLPYLLKTRSQVFCFCFYKSKK